MSQLYEHYNTGDDGAGAVRGTFWQFQTFTPETAHTITSGKLLIYRTGLPGTLTVGIRNVDANHKPTGGDLCSGTTNASSLPTGSPYEWREITLGDGAPISAGIEYAIVVRAIDGDGDNLVGWREVCITPEYENGLAGYSLDSGSTWGVWGVDLGDPVDFMFEEWGEPIVVPTAITQAATNIEQNVARINGQISDDGGAACEARFRYRPYSVFPYTFPFKFAVDWTATEWQNTLETDSTFYEDLTELDEGTEYEFQTQSKNSAGEGAWSASAYFETTLLAMTPSPAQAIGSVVAPTVILGSVSITPDPAESIAQVIQPNVRQGNIIYGPTAVDAIGKAVSPSVILGSLLLTPDFVSAIGGRVNPVVVLGSTSKTPTYIEAIAGVVAPIVSIAGVLYVTPAAIDAIGGRVNPTVILGSIIITADALSAIGEVVAPNAVQGNIIFCPAFVKALGAVVAPTVIGGQLILEPESIEAIARGENPEVILASMTITPEFIKAIAGVVAPYVLTTWIGRKLRLVIVTSQYRKVNVTTCQKRKVNIVTGQKRKVRVITGA